MLEVLVPNLVYTLVSSDGYQSVRRGCNKSCSLVKVRLGVLVRLPLFTSAFCLSVLFATSPSGATTISSVTFTGTLTDPTFTVDGTGFGSQPAVSVAAQSGYTGEDYGVTALSFHDLGPLSFNAGQNIGTGRDTIGLVISSYTDTEIVFTLGSTYADYYYPIGMFQIQNGDPYDVEVNGVISAANTVTPEPSSIALLGTGMLGIAGVLRKRFA